ncbi:MAG: hypothetical protein ABR511_01985 [Acidimicrobiales bacterium]
MAGRGSRGESGGRGSSPAPTGAPSTVGGAACGYTADVSLFGGPATVRGCGQTVPPGDAQSASPSVELPPGGSATAVTATDPAGAVARYGPAVVLGGPLPPGAAAAGAGPPPTGPLSVRTKGRRSVTSSASVKRVGAGPFSATSVRSKAAASASGASASTTIAKGVVVTAVDGDGNPTATTDVPSDPPADLTVEGVNGIGDRFRAVFNEQAVGADGTITVSAVHLYLLGPTATGDVIIARSSARA